MSTFALLLVIATFAAVGLAALLQGLGETGASPPAPAVVLKPPQRDPAPAPAAPPPEARSPTKDRPRVSPSPPRPPPRAPPLAPSSGESTEFSDEERTKVMADMPRGLISSTWGEAPEEVDPELHEMTNLMPAIDAAMLEEGDDEDAPTTIVDVSKLR